MSTAPFTPATGCAKSRCGRRRPRTLGPDARIDAVVPTRGMFTFDGLIKHDVRTGSEDVLLFGEGVFGSETVVAPKSGALDEDDAWLITFTSDVPNDESYCVIYDAKDLSAGWVARVRLPERISSGTHACWAAATAC